MPRRTPPYLPFLEGPPVIAPALKPIGLEKWLTPDTEADAWLLEKHTLMAERPSDTVLGDVDGAASRELLSMVGEATGERCSEYWPNALATAGALVSDDLCLLEPENGAWTLCAGVVAAPTFWRLEDQIGKTLGGLHSPVPGGDPELASRINRIFDGLQPARVLERFNWTVQVSGERFTPRRPTADGAEPEDLHLRVERQTIRKLPETGAICFTIRVCVDPLLPVLSDPEIRETFEDSWIGADKDIRAYKGWDDIEDLVGQACRQSAAAG
ncbi:DUF3445 domain-containing protein [Henriciella sp. AS95]|uniref:heme-dependent oxidative N-demethylase family protein n=1 Tax=Henriciella sp. AS95 TaxID=3135782 RepID=UPI003171996C